MTNGHTSWNNRIWRRNCIHNKMTVCHEINWNNRSWCRNWIQSKPMDGHKSWKNRIWHRKWIQNKPTGGHNMWSRNWQDDQERNKLTSHSIESVGQAVGVRPDKSHGRNRHGSVQNLGAGKASSNTRIQMSLGHGSRSTLLDGWQVCCVGRGSTFACVQRCRRQSHDDCISTSRGEEASDGCQAHDTTREMGLCRV